MSFSPRFDLLRFHTARVISGPRPAQARSPSLGTRARSSQFGKMIFGAERHLSGPLSLTRASLGAPRDRFRWGEAEGHAEGSGQVRRIGEARVHGGCPHQFTGRYLARGMLER